MKKTTRFEESIIAEWDDSTGLGMKEGLSFGVEVLLMRMGGGWEKGLWAAASTVPPHSHFPPLDTLSLSLCTSEFSQKCTESNGEIEAMPVFSL